jgi:hypothetical protein
MKQQHNQKIILFGAIALSLGNLHAAVFNYTDGNLILGFQATAGQGSNQNVFVSLGSPITLRDNGNAGTLANIGSTLSSVYGSDWYTRTDLWFGVVANLNQQPTSGIGSRTPVNGDPSRTFYISQPAASPGTGIIFAANTYPSDALGLGGNALAGMERALTPVESGTGWNFTDPDPLNDGVPLDGIAGVLNQTINQHATAWTNGWSAWNPVSAAAFTVFTGGIQQNFGKGTAQTYVDLQRILATNTGAAPTGVVGGGTYETTISISSTGVVSANAASSSNFTTWIGTFNPPLTNAADRTEGADPDKDGIANVLEFVLNGNPAVSNQAILPTLGASGSNYVFSFTRRADSAGEVTQVFEYSTDLVDWTTNTPITIPTTPGIVGFVTVGASTGTPPNQVQAVTVSVPKGTNTKLFGRLKVVK